MDSNIPGIVAHRGFNGCYPENTRRAFEEALKLDIYGIECDVNMTKDGQAVVIHDLSVDRTAMTVDGERATGEVAELTLEEIRQLNFGTPEDPQQIMLLSELLDLLAQYPGKHLLIETKHPSPFGAELDEEVARIVRAHSMDTGEQVHLISFNPEAIERFRELLPELRSFALMDPTDPLPVDFGQATGPGPSVRQAQAEPEALGAAEQPSYVWTVNLPREMQWCRARGVDLMATDLPQLALETFAGE